MVAYPQQLNAFSFVRLGRDEFEARRGAARIHCWKRDSEFEFAQFGAVETNCDGSFVAVGFVDLDSQNRHLNGAHEFEGQIEWDIVFHLLREEEIKK